MSENNENIKLSTSQPQETNSQDTDTNTISLNYLNTLVSGILVAQKRGIYSLEEAGILADPVKRVSEFLKKVTDAQTANQQKETTTTTTTN
jgi:hypothetical protein